MRSSSESMEHVALVQAIVQHYRANGYTDVCADLSGETQPGTVSGTKRNHIPDATAISPTKTLTVAEAETAATLGDQDCISQITLFADFAANCGGEFHLVVSEANSAAALALVREYNLPNTRVFHV